MPRLPRLGGCRLTRTAVPRFTELQTRPEISSGAYSQLEDLSSRESFLSSIFGRDCYSQALLQINRDCNDMSTDHKYRLAHAMNLCFLAANGHPGYPCSPRMSARDCSAKMDDRAFASYNQFFSNIHSLCLYVSNREFERHTAQLLNKLHAGGSAAREVLEGVAAGLRDSRAEQRALQDSLAQLREDHGHMGEAVQEGLVRLGALQRHATALEDHMQRQLAFQDDMSQRQGRLLAAMDDAEARQRRQQEAAAAAWGAALNASRQLEARQARYEQLQEALAASSSQLLSTSSGLVRAVEGVAAAQQRTTSLMARWLGQHWTLQDLAFYVAAAAGVLLLTSPGGGLASARLPLSGLLLCTGMGERLLRQHLAQWLPLVADGLAGVPLLPLLGDAATASRYLRLLAAVTAAALLARRALRQRQQAAADQGALQAIQQRLDVMVDQQLLILQHLGASPSPTGAKTRSPGPTPGQHADGRYAQRTPMTMPLYPGWQLAATPGTPPMAGPLELAGAGPTSRSPHVRPVGDHQLAKVDLPGMGLAPAGPLVFVGQEVLVQQPGVSHEGRGTRRARAHVAAVEGAGAGVQTRQQARQSAQSQGQPSHAGNAGVQLQPVAGDQGLPIKGEQCQRQPLPALPPSQQGAGTAGSAEQGRGSARRRAREGQDSADGDSVEAPVRSVRPRREASKEVNYKL